jgi:signal transduction histidine kinase
MERDALSKLALGRLEASEARYRYLFHHLPLALFQVDVSGTKRAFDALRNEGVKDMDAYLIAHPEFLDFALDTITVAEVNNHGVLLFGGSKEADLLQPVRLYWQDSPDTFRQILAARFNDESFHSESSQMRTFDGRMLDVTVRMMLPPDFETSGMTLFAVFDISARHQPDAQLKQIKSGPAHAARISILGEMMASISHEITQPLASIKISGEASLRWLNRNPPVLAEVVDCAQRIVADANRASDIIQRVRGMTTKTEAPHQPQQLNTLIEEALRFLQYELQAKDVRLALLLAPGLPPIRGDRIQLQQVVINLLINCLQAMTASRHRVIHITTQRHAEDQLALVIRDSGPGFATDPDTHFAPFFTTKESGMGMGLAICRSILTSHAGTITAANHSMGGAEFEVRLPIDRVGAGLVLEQPVPASAALLARSG